MPMDTNTTWPLTASGWPSVSSGVIEFAIATPAASCAAGRTFEPPG
jgi:hypothetical protein